MAGTKPLHSTGREVGFYHYDFYAQALAKIERVIK